jgi:hypothetical protein
MQKYLVPLAMLAATTAYAGSGTTNLTITLKLPPAQQVTRDEKIAMENELGVTRGLLFRYYEMFNKPALYESLIPRMEEELGLKHGALEAFLDEQPTIDEQTDFLEELIEQRASQQSE